jgi:hypothetical protein
MIDQNDSERVPSVRVKNIVVQVYPRGDASRLAADGIFTFLPATTPVSVNASTIGTPAALNTMQATDKLPPFGTLASENPLATGEVGPHNVLYIKGTNPTGRALQAALFTADDLRWKSVVVPLVGLTGGDDIEALAKAAFDLGKLLDEHDMANITQIKLVHESGREHVSIMLVKALAMGAGKSIAPRSQVPRPTCNMTLQLGTIEDAAVDAVIACLRSSDERTPFAIDGELRAFAGDFFHYQLAGKGKVDGRAFLTKGGLRGVPFRSVLFLINDGKKTGAEYIESVLRAADDLGLKTVALPLLSFVENAQDDVAVGKVIDDLREGMLRFLAGGWRSLELVAAIVPRV